MKCRLLSSAARTDRGALLTFIREKKFSASSKPRLGVGRYPNPEYRGLTYSTFFGLLACTGMRLSEAINLRMQDITADGLVIRHTKFRKSRLLPLHSTTQAALERYLPKRRVFAAIRRSRIRWLAKTQAVSARRLRCISQNYRDDRPSASFGPSAAHNPCVATHICCEGP